jgi:hypothetical protein
MFMRFLNEFTALLNVIAAEHEGAVVAGRNKLLLYFDWQDNDAGGSIRAVNAAQRLLVNFGELSREWYKRAGTISSLSIAVVEGSVSGSGVDAAEFESIAVSGDAVDVAGNICRRARAGEALCTEVVKRSLGSREIPGTLTPIPPITLQGRATALSCFCLRAGKRFDPYDLIQTRSGGPRALDSL